ncbi:hypothetical protein PN416_04595 [Halorubrum ezzemoulense]|uniref:DUF1102 domain-containing protein n=1 Tax=Halorubrum ezzemoulense TaxID=337243 RepID=A0ABT4Z845_HALEZ|nr:hypothetical protein [Halorubrum ezzemoulense]MDB2223857.1 hypothetical protein [Halorubrum ezzemoulense]MDB2294346.1 hypothetical protein [Halorubrum ezzemoulense]MDB9279192.1 hypothetical protein [Halorubrum ezzemoulense]MDB9282714.1 hypothetical protein [Halorubrum ezzemoulense]
MKRRTFLAGIASASTAGTMVVGSGAFTSVSADRRLSVEVADDNRALLAISERGEGAEGALGRSNKGDDQVTFSFPGRSRQFDNPDLGLGTNSVYEFTQDAGEAGNVSPENGLVRIENRGTQPVVVYSTYRTSSELEIEMFDVEDPDKTALRHDPEELSVGDYMDVGFRIRTHDADVGRFDETLTIVAEKPGE